MVSKCTLGGLCLYCFYLSALIIGTLGEVLSCFIEGILFSSCLLGVSFWVIIYSVFFNKVTNLKILSITKVVGKLEKCVFSAIDKSLSTVTSCSLLSLLAEINCLEINLMCLR